MADNPVFSVDVNAFQAANAALKEMQGNTARTKNDLLAVEAALSQLSQAKAGMASSLLIDPESVKLTKELTDNLIKAGVEKEKINKLTAKELTSYDKLSKAEKARVRQAANIQKAKEKTVLYQGKEIQLEKERNRLLKAGQDLYQRGQRFVSRTARSMVGMATSTTGIQLSLAGIVALLLDVYNKSNKIGAMSRQINAQWGNSSTGIATANKSMSMLRTQFWKSVDAAGEITNSLARGGVEQEEMYRLSKDMTASELVRGQSIQEQFSAMKNVALSYGTSGTKAQEMLETVRETSKTIPLLSMSEAVADVTEMATKGRSYNVGLLDTLALYNTLIKKDAASKLGLGDAPREVRKQIASTIAGFGSELGDGFKAALGEGSTAAARVLEFEKLMPAEKFKRMADFISSKTSGFVGAEREIAVRSLLKQFNFTSEEVRKALGEAFTKGGFSAEGLSSVVEEVGKQRELIENEQKNEKNRRTKLYKDASKIAYGLASLEEKLKKSIDNSILGSAGWPEMRKNIDSIAKWALQNIPNAAASLVSMLGDISAYLKKEQREENLDKINKAYEITNATNDAAIESVRLVRYYGKHTEGVGADAAQHTLGVMLDRIIGKGGAVGTGGEAVTKFSDFIRKGSPELNTLSPVQMQSFIKNTIRAQLTTQEAENLVRFISSASIEEARDLLLKQLTEKGQIKRRIRKTLPGAFVDTADDNPIIAGMKLVRASRE